MEDPEDLLQKFLAVATALPGINTIILTGSRARTDSDEYSDLDIELWGPGTSDLIGGEGWLAEVGDLLVCLHLENGGAGEPTHPTCLAVFGGGRKIDITLAPASRMQDMINEGLDDTLARGYRVLWDPSGELDALPPAQGVRRTRPTAREFAEAQASFWFEATQVPIYLARGDLWPARTRDAEMKDELLRMFEWRTLAENPGTDVRYGGHGLHEWLPATLYSDLWEAHAGFRGSDMLRALRVTIDLYAESCAVASLAWGYPSLNNLKPRVLKHISAVAGR